MLPKESGFHLSETTGGLRAHNVTFSMLACPGNYTRRHFCHYGDTIFHPRSGYITTKLHGTSTADVTIMRYFQTELFSRSLTFALYRPR